MRLTLAVIAVSLAAVFYSVPVASVAFALVAAVLVFSAS